MTQRGRKVDFRLLLLIVALTGAMNVALPKGISAAGHRMMDFCSGGAWEGLCQLMEQELSLERMVGAGVFYIKYQPDNTPDDFYLATV